jgi:N-methylhydantoinase B
MSGTIDPITLEVLRHALLGIAEEMNANLIRTGYSPNIKERRDCSSALFDPRGRMIAQAESIPVHLGAMPFSVKEAIARFPDLVPGDTVVLNDPFSGGAHLPDLTFVTPIFCGGVLIGLAANRAHHADVGGIAPGSVSGEATEIYQEGLRLPAVRLWRHGEPDTDLMNVILANVRTPRERRGDLRAQHAANETGRRRLVDLVEQIGADRLSAAVEAVLDYSERRMAAAIEAIPDGVYAFEDRLDNDGICERPIRIAATVRVAGRQLTIDFAGTDPQVTGPVNAVYAVTASAVYYTVRAFTDPDIPPNAGCYRSIEVIAPAGSVVNARAPAAVVGGNLETSQRIVDVLIGALAQALPGRGIAGCQGTMNNLTLGGVDPFTGEPYTLYETIAGGAGAGASWDGVDGVHTHMTNTLNTPIEALETAYPLRVTRYELRADTGGAGRYRGGLGVRRDLAAINHTARVSLLGDRRRSTPYGFVGGRPGVPGEDLLLLPDGTIRRLAAKGSVLLEPGSTLSVRTPGGGGYGPAEERDPAAVRRDVREGRISWQRAAADYGHAGVKEPEGPTHAGLGDAETGA